MKPLILIIPFLIMGCYSPEKKSVNELESSFIKSDSVALSKWLYDIENDIENHPANATKNALEVLNRMKTSTPEFWIANIHQIIGFGYYLQSDFKNALEHWLLTLRFRQKSDDLNSTSVALGNIGNLYYSMGDYDHALEYFRKAQEIKEKLGHKNGLSITWTNMGNVFWKQKKFSEAMKSYVRSQRIYEELKSKPKLAIVLGNIGNVFADLGDSAMTTGNRNEFKRFYSLAYDYYLRSFDIKKEINDLNGLATTGGNIGSLLIDLGDYENAERYLDSALSISTDLGAKELMNSHHESLSKLFEKKEDYKNALSHFKKSNEIRDSLFNEEKAKDIGRLEQKHEFELSALKKAQEEAEKSRQLTVALSRRNTLEYSGILIGIFALFVMVFFIGKFNLPPWAVELSVFIPFLILFEFILVFIDPYIESITGGEPVWKLLVNAILAAIIFPMHAFFEKWLKRRVGMMKI